MSDETQTQPNDPRVTEEPERSVRDRLLSWHTPELTALVGILHAVSDSSPMNAKLYYAAKEALESRDA